MKTMFKIDDMCRVFGVARSGYYSWLKRPLSRHDKEEITIIKPAIRQAFDDSRQTYGCARISAVLRRIGISISEKRSRRIMREENLVAKAARRFKRTTNSKHNHKKAPDLVKRDFSSSKPHSLWTSDFTAIWTREGWLYLVVFLDVCTRMVVGWAACATMAETTLIKAFNDALSKRIPLPSAIIHSDQGGQYFGKLFQAILNLYHIQQSMGATGICFDNAITESLWNLLKTECFLDVIPETRREAELMIFDYFETFYNVERLHSSIGYMSPEEFEKSL
jgi:transposase InsO family protein